MVVNKSEGRRQIDESDLDPTFLNHFAWNERWIDRNLSIQRAHLVLEFSKRNAKTRQVGRGRRNGLAFRTLAWQELWRGQFIAAEDYAVRAEARLKNAGADSALVTCFYVLASVSIARLKFAQARDYFDVARQIPVTSENSSPLVDLFVGMSQLERISGRLDLAQQAINLAKRHAVDESDACLIDIASARALLADGRPNEALETAISGLENCEMARNQVLMPYAVQTVASIMISLRKTRNAKAMLDKGLLLAEEAQDKRARCQLLFEVSRLLCLTPEPETALGIAIEGRQLAEDLGYPMWKGRFLELESQLHEKLGDFRSALESLKGLVSLRGGAES